MDWAMSARPSSRERMVRWNVADRDGMELWNSLYDEQVDNDPYVYASSVSVDELSEADEEEPRHSSAIKEEFAALWERYRIRAGIPDFDVCCNPFQISIDEVLFSGELDGTFESTLDRTVTVPVIHEGILAFDHISMMQEELLRQQYPLWRLWYVESDGETGIVVYPDAITIGERAIWRDEEGYADRAIGVLKQWRAEVYAIRSKQRGPRNRQALWVRQNVTRQIRQMANASAIRLAVFDNYEGDESRRSAWVVFRRGHTFEPVGWDATAKGDWSSGHTFRITETGTVSCSRDAGAPPAFYASQFIFPSDGSLRLRQKTTGLEIVLTAADSIDDSELLKLYGSTDEFSDDQT